MHLSVHTKHFLQVSIAILITSMANACLLFALAMGLVGSTVAYAQQAPLDFEFIKNPPGELVSIDTHRLHVDCKGQGDVTVLFESGLGGSSLEWQSVRNAIQSGAVGCLYDRSGYAWSDPSPFRPSARQLALEANKLLNTMNINGPLILVGHSFGGFIIRQLAEFQFANVIGMVLVDSSHENQINRFEALGGAAVMPRGKHFVISSAGVPENLPEEIRKKIEALSRMRKTYAATHAEMAQFRLSATQTAEHRRVLDIPVIIMRRGKSPFKNDRPGQRKTALWNELQQDLLKISSNGSMVVAEHSGHHIHVDEPLLVSEAIRALIDE